MYYHEDEYNNIRIVGFEVEPFSVKHEIDGKWEGEDNTKLSTCEQNQHVLRELRAQAVEGVETLLEGDNDHTIIFTYDVRWEASTIKWASRWDSYLKMTNPEIHWFSIINSLVIVIFLSAFVAMIMIRTLRRDLDNYNNQNMSPEEQQEETGWKMIHGDVFRTPKCGGFLTVLAASGIQILLMSIITLIFALLGFLSPANRGSLMTALLVLYVFMGIFAGYYGTRFYTMMQLPNWKSNTFYISIFFPGISFAIFFVLNLFVWGEKSSGAVPFTTLLALLILWFGVSVPLVYLGANIAVKKPPIEPPCKINTIPRAIIPEKIGLINPLFNFSRWYINICCCIYRNIFYYVFSMVTSILLCLWIFIYGLCYINFNMC